LHWAIGQWHFQGAESCPTRILVSNVNIIKESTETDNRLS
jgi:hypothetical protein